jgi:glycerol-3-phosphate dehydrogenase
MDHILIIGGGVGGALAYDLALRGFRVTLLEKGGLLSGTTGRHHGLLHSGARYVLHDPEAARECIAENTILKQIASQAIEPNGGLFVALDEADLSHLQAFLEGCTKANIPFRSLTPSAALALEPHLNPALKAAVQVPDGVMDAFRLAMSFFAGAKSRGAQIRPYCEVKELQIKGRTVRGVTLCNHRTGGRETIEADLVVNSAGPWAGKIAALAGVPIPLQPMAGVMVSVNQRLTHRVINRLHPAGEGDIVVPQRRLSILGTTAWPVNDPDQALVPEEDIQRLYRACTRLIPRLQQLPPHAAWSACRPLISPGDGQVPFAISRTFDCIDHGPRDGLDGLVTLIGGKATTMRAMAEKSADLICRKLSRTVACQTSTAALPSHRHYWHLND